MDINTILSRVNEICQEVVGPNAEKVDQEGIWPQHSLHALQVAGLAGLVVPKECGGLGHGLLTLVRVCEMLGKECASTGLCFGMHCVGSAVISAKATDYQKRHYLEPISQGKHITTLSLSESGTGAHFYFPQTQLKKVSSQAYKITGTKTFVTNGSHADSYVVSTVVVDKNAKPGQFSCVMVSNDAKGIQWGGQWQGLGMRGNSSRTLELKDVEIPKKDLLGKEGDQIWYIFNVVAPYFLMAMSATYLGIASSTLDEARNHLEKRRYSTTGEKLSQNSLLQHRLGVLWAEVERTRQLIYHAAHLGDTNDSSAVIALLSAKAEVADTVVHVVNEVMTLMGGIAYRDNGKLSRHLRDARAAHVMAPTTDLLRTWTGRALLGLPLLGE
ncbi:MAG: acyl-CoA dehydrogenase family protein [Candidatus Levyibacteriota bacterium]